MFLRLKESRRRDEHYEKNSAVNTKYLKKRKTSYSVSPFKRTVQAKTKCLKKRT